MDSIIPADCREGSAIRTSCMPTITQRTSAIVSASCARACADDSVSAPTSAVNKVFRIEVLLDLRHHPETTYVKLTGNARMLSNGEVEGPPRSAQMEPRVHTVFPHPRRHYRASRTPPTIVRCAHCV